MSHWSEKIDLGTKEGMEEFEVMCALSHNPGYVWLTPKGLSIYSGIPIIKIEKMLTKFVSNELVTIHPNKSGYYGETNTVKAWIAVDPSLLGS